MKKEVIEKVCGAIVMGVFTLWIFAEVVRALI